jgi:hypothetical protein
VPPRGETTPRAVAGRDFGAPFRAIAAYRRAGFRMPDDDTLVTTGDPQERLSMVLPD